MALPSPTVLQLHMHLEFSFPEMEAPAFRCDEVGAARLLLVLFEWSQAVAPATFRMHTSDHACTLGHRGYGMRSKQQACSGHSWAATIWKLRGAM